MWGTTSSCDELTGDFGGAFEATSIDDIALQAYRISHRLWKASSGMAKFTTFLAGAKRSRALAVQSVTTAYRSVKADACSYFSHNPNDLAIV
jgi:hypothetical protein